jgi:predicted aminopeptidase
MGAGAAGLALAAAAAVATSGCSNLPYYWQQTSGHLALLRAAQPVEDWLARDDTDAALKRRLQAAQRIRAFASDALALPRNRSYTRYADLHRPYAVWNVVAAPELSLAPKQWCFAVTGCVSYRGFFERAGADALAAQLRAEGWDVNVYGVPAYSTLGYLDWLGGDPLLSTFIQYPEGELARLIFHELAHQVAYAKDDSTFNESFATAVEELGVERYLARYGDDAMRSDYAAFDARRRDFRALLLKYRDMLQALYASAQSDDAKRARKAAVFAMLQADYARLKQDKWQGFAGYDRYFNQPLNNAHLAGIATYTAQLPLFERLFRDEGEDFARFYARVRALAAMDRAARAQALEKIAALK